MAFIPVEFHWEDGVIDSFEILPVGVVRLHGWLKVEAGTSVDFPQLLLNSKPQQHTHFFHTRREDVQSAMGYDDPFRGLTIEYILPELPEQSTERHWQLAWKDETRWEHHDELPMRSPFYPYLLDDERIFHKDMVYCSGLPIEYLNPEIFDLCLKLPESILDIGCGLGTYVKALRKHGRDCIGVELDRPEIRAALLDEVKPYVKLHRWRKNHLPFKDNSFSSAICIEVMEHIEKPERWMEEISRVVRDELIITVPDMSGVALNSFNSMVPWHLLEKTHVNFFNQQSLIKLVGQYFSNITPYRISRTQTNDVSWFGNLMLHARR